MSRVWARVLVLLLVLTGCAGPELPTGPGGDQPAAAATDELRVGLTEWSVETGGVTLLPGEVQVVVTNTGATGHDVVVHGEQGTWRTPVLPPGERYEMVITTSAGEQLELVCTVTGHASSGMRTEVPVDGGAAA